MVLRGEVKHPNVSGHMFLGSLIYCRHTGPDRDRHRTIYRSLTPVFREHVRDAYPNSNRGRAWNLIYYVVFIVAGPE